MIQSIFRFTVLASLSVTLSLTATPETQRQYLSGRDKDNTVPWRFLCTSGANSGVWTNLPVPSHWDMKGFGTLTYRKDATNAWNERGLYEHDFAMPADWNGKRVFLVFEGVMTDTSAKLNGESVGPTHQGGFYRFKYEVTKLVKFGATNRLEVDVARHSANESVNKAERLADYWVFAGIYRPVYLEAVPQSFIERVAIDAKADGTFAMDVFANGAAAADSVEAQLLTLDGKAVGQTFLSAGSGDFPVARSENTGLESPVNRQAGKPALRLTTQISAPKQWTAETPNLYNVEVRLKRGSEILHTYKQRFGFRTFEVRDGDGLYLNGCKIILKGVNRHSFWPDSGRCLSEAVHRLDIETIKDMNGNAVRMSHYPPDVEFLDLCDELGLYVLDELAGWQKYYDTPTGTRLVEAMVTRDVNHPSIILWNNGNEGGWNTNVDHVFGQFDPQQRRVLHPWAVFSGINTAHYLAFDRAEAAASGKSVNDHSKVKVAEGTNQPSRLIYMPTEFMHALYDGGAAAGLADYWGMMMSHSNCAGGFIWAMVDEAVKRPDTGQLDTADNQAPDGIVGPYREREGSFYAIKQLWSPIQVKREPDGQLRVENHFGFTTMEECQFFRSLFRFGLPSLTNSGFQLLAQERDASPSISPGESATIPKLDDEFSPFDIPQLAIIGPGGRQIGKWNWANNTNGVLNSSARIVDRADSFGGVGRGVRSVTCKGVTAQLDGETGFITGLQSGGKNFSLLSGPRPASSNSTLTNIVWQFREDGWLQCSYTCKTSGTNDAIGVLFDYPENLVKRKRWLGDGPYRVWKNRLGGGTLGVWTHDYNNTITGYRGWVYPEFKGFFANVRWLQLETTEGLITVVPENIPFVQVLTPEQPPANLVANTKMNVPQCGLGFMHAIPAMGSKFKGAESTGPQGQPNIGQGEYSGTVSFYFGKLP